MPNRPAVLTLAAAAAVAAALTACSATSGSGSASSPPASQPHSFPTGIAPASTPTTSAQAPSTSVTTHPPAHPAPAKPVRTATVKGIDGITYRISVWQEVKDATCFDHAYGKVATFLTEHPCRGLDRLLATTTVNGRSVGFAQSSTSIPGSGTDIYANAIQLRKLELADGTGSINDLLREGYELPSGPTSVPTHEAFNCLGQDTGVTVWDAWYLDGPTPDNDPGLIKMTRDIFLSY